MANEIAGRFQAALQSTLLWGALCMVATIILAVVAVMIHDFRWVLGLAWPFAAVAVWEFSRIIFSSKRVTVLVTGVGAIISGLLLLWLYFGLAPIDSAGAQPAEAPKQEAPKTKLVSTLGKSLFRCTRPKNIDGQDPKKARAEAKLNMRVIGEKFGLSVDLNDIPNGVSLEITPKTDEGRLRMSAAEKYTIEIRPSGPDLLVYARMQLISVIGMIADLMPADPKSDPIIAETKMIEQLVGTTPGGCRLY